MLIGLESVLLGNCCLENVSRSDPSLYLLVRKRLGVLVTHLQFEPELLKLVDPPTWCGAATRSVHRNAETLALVAQVPK